ncbi:MAG: DUF1893 domain-containing protein [Candidatus Bathyarchaeales archaeon]
MKDLEIAKKRLHSENLTLSVVKNSEVIFESKNRGISGFLQALEKFGDSLKGASAADRVVGKAIALLCVYAGIKAVYASTLSKGAKTVFERHKVYFEWDMLVEKILDANKVEACPFEKAAINISNPREAYVKFKDLQRTLMQARES